jgi:hypothetical protein
MSEEELAQVATGDASARAGDMTDEQLEVSRRRLGDEVGAPITEP